MAYVDGFVIPIKKTKLKAYKKMAQFGKKLWMKCGALDYKECVADDLKTQGSLPFTKLARCRPGETVVFAFITYKSKAHRNAVNKKVFSDPSMKNWDPKKFPMPFDMKRMSHGGFKGIVEA